MDTQQRCEICLRNFVQLRVNGSQRFPEADDTGEPTNVRGARALSKEHLEKYRQTKGLANKEIFPGGDVLYFSPLSPTPVFEESRSHDGWWTPTMSAVNINNADTAEQEYIQGQQKGFPRESSSHPSLMKPVKHPAACSRLLHH